MRPPGGLSGAGGNAALFMGRQDYEGRVAGDVRADLLLLGHNPLQDARHFGTIGTVFRDGRPLETGGRPRACD